MNAVLKYPGSKNRIAPWICSYIPSHKVYCEPFFGGGAVLFNKSRIDNLYPDYSLYPDCDYAIGFLTRGCPNNCEWCYVPQKEGNIKPYKKWEELVRQDTDKLVLMDNNILASEFGIEQLRSLTKSNIKIDLNQGMDIRLVTEDIVKIFKELKWI